MQASQATDGRARQPDESAQAAAARGGRVVRDHLLSLLARFDSPVSFCFLVTDNGIDRNELRLGQIAGPERKGLAMMASNEKMALHSTRNEMTLQRSNLPPVHINTVYRYILPLPVYMLIARRHAFS
jgi:hypothetical protein